MIAIIAEKLSVAQDIARIVGATENKNGYMEGNGYMVTWALGHLVELALPEFYRNRYTAANLPIVPDPFTLTIRKKRTDNRCFTDPTASRQLRIIRSLLGDCQQIIAATDAGGEGELIFRNIYKYLGLKQPVKRLWISSLTDEAIDRGLRNMQGGSKYDRLYKAADCRAKADWLIDTNASKALVVAMDDPSSSLGRVQTPTLAMICSRYLENKGFLSSDYRQIYITLKKGDTLRKFRYTHNINDRTKAEEFITKVKSFQQAIIKKVEINRLKEAPPLLYDLTALQMDCNIFYDFSADKTLSTAQSLYEKKLITYPRTSSRYISKDIMPGIPSLLRMILRMEQFSHFRGSIDPLRTNYRSVDQTKVKGHHAMIITGNYPQELSTAESQVYELICGRMLEAFAPKCEKQIIVVDACIDDMLFRSSSFEVLVSGWRGVYDRQEEPDEYDDDIKSEISEYIEGEPLIMMGHTLAQKKTRPRALFTEATLLTAMEVAGNDLKDEKEREAMSGFGLGTPATRASTIETLLHREYIERSGKWLIPTKKGLRLYKAVKDLRIADVQLTGKWENSLASIESGQMNPETFMKAITVFTRQVTAEVLSLDIEKTPVEKFLCPKCHAGNITIRHKLAKCDNDSCGLVVTRRFLNKTLTDNHLAQLLFSGKTRLIKGFHGKKDKTFDAYLKFDKGYNLTFQFPSKKSTDNRIPSKIKSKKTQAVSHK